MKTLSTPIIRLTLLLLGGIIFGSFFDLPLIIAFLVPLILLVPFLISWKVSKNLFSEAFSFGIFSYFLFFGMGIFIAALHQPQNRPKHYINQITSEENENLILAEVTQVLKPDLFSEKAIARVRQIDHSAAEGKVLLLLPKEESKMSFLEGQQILFKAFMQEFPGPKNPHQFDYRRFMATRDVLRQVQLKRGSFELLPQKEQNLESLAASGRREIVQKLQKSGFQKEELATVQALLLGQKQDISAEVYNNFAAAGVIHILAVSGLHVGIILLLLNWLLSPLDRLQKGRFLKGILLLFFLWSFAILSGLSPSVVRAVSMFSFLAVGMQLKRRSSSLIAVFVSLLFLLLFKPQWIFEVGFQLSYIAVLAILLLQPKLYTIWSPAYKPVRFFWGILTGTVAAQIGVLPLSLYYFHQFPGLFFLSNLIILPFLGFLLGFGILVILLALPDLLPPFLTSAFAECIGLLNSFVAWAARQESFLFNDISFSLTEVLLFYLLIITLIAFLYSFSFRKLATALSAVILLQLFYISDASEEKQQLLIFHNSKQVVIGFQKGEKLDLFLQKSFSEEPVWLKNFRIGQNIQQIEIHPMKNAFVQQDELLVVIDSTGIFPKQPKQRANVLLTGSPKVNLERVIHELQPKRIIAGGHNYRSVVQRWQQTAKEHEIPFSNTFEDGAFIVKQALPSYPVLNFQILDSFELLPIFSDHY